MATRTIANGGGNWNATGTWVEGIVPVLGDAVVATATSGQLTVNVTTAACTSVDFTNYTNTFTVSSGQQLAVSGTFKFVAGMSVAGTGTLRFNATATITSAGLTWTGNITFGGTSQTYTLGDAWVINGSITFSSTTTATVNGNSFTIGGGLTVTTILTISGTTSYTLNGTGTLGFTGNGRINSNITINTAGTITINVIRMGDGTITYTAGTIAGPKQLVTQGDTIFNCADITWSLLNNLSGGGAICTLVADLNVSGSASWTANTNNTNTFNGNKINFSGTITIAPGSTGITYAGTTVLNCTGTTTFSAPNSNTSMAMPIVLNTTGIVTMNSNANLLIKNSFTITAVGSFVTTGNTFRLSTGSSISNAVAGITFNIIQIEATTSFTGTQGFTTSTLTATTVGVTATLTIGNIYIVSNTLTCTGTAASNITIKSSSAGNAAILTLPNDGVATQSVAHVIATDIDSSKGQTIWNYKGTLNNAQNWKLLTSATRNPTIGF